METKKNLKARFYKLFKSSNCTMTTKNIANSVENSVHFSPQSYYPRSDDANTLFNLHRSLSVPFFPDYHPTHNHIHHNSPANRPPAASHKLRRSPSAFNLLWDNSFIMSKKKLLRSNPYGFTSSSSSSDVGGEGNDDEEEDDGLFSSDDEFETGTPFSSRQFSSDSSEFYYNPSLSGRKKIAPMMLSRRRPRLPPRPPRRDESNDPPRKTTTHKKKLKRPSRKAKKVAAEVVEEEPPCYAYAYAFAGGDESEVGAEVDGSGVAEVKDSIDPYADFSISMLEMIVKKQLFGKDKLDSLLQCYLSLNQTHNHPIILRVFADICKTVLG